VGIRQPYHLRFLESGGWRGLEEEARDGVSHCQVYLFIRSPPHPAEHCRARGYTLFLFVSCRSYESTVT
jgi:hypothetical protein